MTLKLNFLNKITICVVFSFLPLYALDDDDFKNNQLVIIYLKTCIRNQRPLFLELLLMSRKIYFYNNDFENGKTFSGLDHSHKLFSSTYLLCKLGKAAPNPIVY